MIRSGELREKITIERKIQVQRPDGGFDTVWNPLHQTFASVEEVRPSADVIAQQQNIYMMVKVKIRYNPEVNIQNGDRIDWRGFNFMTLTPKVDPLRRWIEFVAHSEIEETER